MDTIKTQFEWDEAKRQVNLLKHRVDFANAADVFESANKVTFEVVRSGETRYVDVAVTEVGGLFLTLVYVPRGANIRVISFRTASRRERAAYLLARKQD